MEKTPIDKKFYLDSFIFITSIIEFYDILKIELNYLTINSYHEGFSCASKFLNGLGEKVDEFVSKWKDIDEYKVCRTLSTIKEYWGYYCISFNNSSPSGFRRDAGYVTDSLTTAKIVLKNKLKELKKVI